MKTDAETFVVEEFETAVEHLNAMNMILVSDYVALARLDLYDRLRKKMGEPVVKMSYKDGTPKFIINPNGRWDIKSQRLYARTPRDAVYARMILNDK